MSSAATGACPGSTTLAHAFPNDAADNVTLTYGYDAAGREISRGYTNPSYAWSTSAATTSYSIANALNQNQPTGSFTYQWWPEGPQKEGPALQENYDEQGQLTLDYVTATPGTIDPNDWWQAQTDALGHRMYHERQTTAGVAYPLIDEATDGLRLETILDTQYSVLSGVQTLQGYRRYVLGPDPDEYLAWIDLDGAVRYPHTDREGTAIAESAAGSVVHTWTYDVYGQGGGAISDVGPGITTYPFRYTGQRLDPSTGLYNYKARDYSAALGRFLQPDPAGTSQGPNLYAYVNDDPTDLTDPTGETCVIANGWSSYCMRAYEYAGFDSVVGSQTRFFGAASMTTRMLADLDMPIGNNVISSTTRGFMGGLSRDLQGMNEREALAIEHGRLGGPNLDARMVHAEQTSVQGHLDALAKSDPSGYGRVISEVNGLLNGKNAASMAGSLYGDDRHYQSVLNGVRTNLGRDIDFSKQGDREAIGNALIKDLRSSGACTTTGSRIPTR